MRRNVAATIVLASFVASSAQAAPDFAQKLQEADRLAWLTDWYRALPIYVEVEQAAVQGSQSS
jgi:hypothetical protein